jgi:hypothetical protein
VTFVTDGTPHPAVSTIARITAARIAADTRSIEPFLCLKTPGIVVKRSAIKFKSTALQEVVL